MSQHQFYRMLVILNGAVPLLMLAYDAYRGQLGANSVNYALHVTGILCLLFLFLSLLITPLRWLTGWSGWIAFRRALGLYGFFYSILHVVIYVGFDRGLSLSSTLNEIWRRRFLQVGTAAVLLMIPLAVTSTNSMIQRLGPRRWKLLHRAAYVVAVLGVIHYYMLVKSDVRQPLAFAGVLTGLLAVRFGRHYVEVLQSAKRQENRAKSQLSMASSHAVQVSADDQGTSRRPWKGALKVAAIFRETPDVTTFRLTALDGAVFPFTYLPGQFLNVQLTIDGQRVNRSYTIASSPTRRGYCELSIKREPLGLASRFIHDQLSVGDILNVTAPAGKFTFTGEESTRVLLVAGGVGITPMMSIVRYLTDRVWFGDIYFLIVARTEEDLIFQDEIQWLQRRFPRLHACMTLTRCAPDSMWNGERGRVTESLLNRFVPDLTQLPIYLCGPTPMMDDTRELLLEMGVPGSQIKTEAFASGKNAKSPIEMEADRSNGGLMPADPTGTLLPTEITNDTALITFARSNVQREFSSDFSVLEAAEASSIELPYECRAGICGQCKTRLIEGTVVMECEDALSASEKARGLILACQARPRSSLVVDA